MGRKKKGSRELLTEFELKVMNVLWRLRSGTVQDVLDGLDGEEPYAYTTVSTVLRLLEERGVLESFKNGRSHIYAPTVAKEEYENKALGHFVENVFENKPLALVRRLLDSEQVTEEELDEIRKLLEEKG